MSEGIYIDLHTPEHFSPEQRACLVEIVAAAMDDHSLTTIRINRHPDGLRSITGPLDIDPAVLIPRSHIFIEPQAPTVSP